MNNKALRAWTMVLALLLLGGCAGTQDAVMGDGTQVTATDASRLTRSGFLSDYARLAAPGLAAQGLHIRSSVVEPADPRVATKYRGRWYCIDSEDEASKRWFTILALLANAPAGATATAPVLTIPGTGRR